MNRGWVQARMVIGSENWTLAHAPRRARGERVRRRHCLEYVIRANPTPRLPFPPAPRRSACSTSWLLAPPVARSIFRASLIFCLDEYVGVTVEDPNSLTRWLSEALPEPDRHQTRSTPHPSRYRGRSLPKPRPNTIEAISARGGLDLAILGLGPNGHIGYNEPGSSADSRTRVITLTAESRNQASAYWEGSIPIPDQAMTMGVGTLLESKQIVLLVIGEAKADILRRTLEEPMSAEVPASWLRIAGPRLTIIADEAAASELSIVRSGIASSA